MYSGEREFGRDIKNIVRKRATFAFLVTCKRKSMFTLAYNSRSYAFVFNDDVKLASS